MQHTYESLAGVFNPLPPDDEEAPDGPARSHSGATGVSETPLQSVRRTRVLAHESLVRTASQYADSQASSTENTDPEAEEEVGEEGGQEGSGDDDGGENSDHTGGGGDDDEPRETRRRKRNPVFEGRPEPRARGNQPAQQQPRCFLCDYCTSAEARFVSTFIADNIANMDVSYMAQQIRNYVLDKRPEWVPPMHPLRCTQCDAPNAMHPMRCTQCDKNAC
jgi:hypothetical protein